MLKLSEQLELTGSKEDMDFLEHLLLMRLLDINRFVAPNIDAREYRLFCEFMERTIEVSELYKRVSEGEEESAMAHEVFRDLTRIECKVTEIYSLDR